MMLSKKDVTEKAAAVSNGNETRRQWRKPDMSRIEIKRTMFGGGSAVDGTGNPSVSSP